MLAELLKELVLELLRALFLEELCQRVKERLLGAARSRRSANYEDLLRRMQARRRSGLVHKITTQADQKL
jgi:hypothetical protein